MDTIKKLRKMLFEKPCKHKWKEVHPRKFPTVEEVEVECIKCGEKNYMYTWLLDPKIGGK